MEVLPETLDRLSTRLDTLERRVYALEHPAEVLDFHPAPVPGLSDAAKIEEAHRPTQAGGMFSIAGKAMLGIAGAYVLRAVAETGSIPMLAVAAIGIVYAILWLVLAARVPAGAWLASTTYACTSAAILAPMLWELTLNFKALTAPMTAGVLSAFVIVATVLAWKFDLKSVSWVANVTAALVAIALMVATHNMAPFIAALLLMAVLCEYSAGRNRGLSVRPLVAAGADLAIWALIFIYSSAPSTRADYRGLGTTVLLVLACTLFLIYGASVAIRTALLREKITSFEIVQTMVAFLLAASSVLYFGSSAGATVLGILCLLLAGTGYAATFILFSNSPEQRNYRVFATWSAALLLVGGFLCLPPMVLAAFLGAAAILATALGVRPGRLTLEFHGVVYLAAAVGASGLLDYAFHALAAAIPAAPGWTVWVVSVCAVLCYAVERPCPEEPWKQQLLHIASASLATGSVAALLISGIVGLTALNIHPGAHHVAFIRTFSLCILALALAFTGSHWRRTELTRIGYALLVLVAAKLVFEDLRHGHLGFIAASIFLYAVTLIAVPWLARMGQRALGNG